MSTETVQVNTDGIQQTEQKTAPTTTETSAETKRPDDMAAKFAALAKKERIARMAQQTVRQKEQALAAREKAIADRERQWDEEFKSSPLEAIKRRGYSYEDLVKAALNDGRFDPETEVRGVKTELQRFREEQAEKEQKAKQAQFEAQKKAEEETVTTFKKNIYDTIQKNKEKYELTALYDADGMVFDTIEEHYLRTSKAGSPKILTIDEACELVESYLEGEIERTATSSKKFQSKYQAMKAQSKEEARTSGKSSTTLTNQQTSAAATLLNPAVENDRIKRALAALG